MRRTLLFALVFTVRVAAADPLIDIPTARKIPFGVYKFEFAEALAGGGTQLAWLDMGIGKSFEAALREEEFDGGRIRPTADLMYSFISALPGVSPGVAFGVQDMANSTRDGRRAYGVFTFREPTRTFDFETPLDFTFGISAGRSILPFVGLALPISSRAKILAEHNGYRAAGGIQYDLSRSLSLRLLVRGTRSFGDLVWNSRF